MELGTRFVFVIATLKNWLRQFVVSSDITTEKKSGHAAVYFCLWPAMYVLREVKVGTTQTMLSTLYDR